MSNACSLKVVGIAPGHLSKCSRDEFPLMSYLSTQKNLFLNSCDTGNAEETEPLPDAAELKRRNDERLEKILREARIQLQNKNCALQDPKKADAASGKQNAETESPVNGNLVLEGKGIKDNNAADSADKPNKTKNNHGSQIGGEYPENCGRLQEQQKGFGVDAAMSRQNALERLRRMEWQRNKSDALREPVELHPLPPKRDFAAEEADSTCEEVRGKSKTRNRRRSRQQQQQKSEEKPQVVTVVGPPTPFQAINSTDKNPLWRTRREQETGRVPFPPRVNVWLQRPGVDLFPKQTENLHQQEDDELSTATEASMMRVAIAASLKSAEEEGCMQLPQSSLQVPLYRSCCTKSTFEQPPPIENEDWDADLAEEKAVERNTPEKPTERIQDKCENKMMINMNKRISERSVAEVTPLKGNTSPVMRKRVDQDCALEFDESFVRGVKHSGNVPQSTELSNGERNDKFKMKGKDNTFNVKEKPNFGRTEWESSVQQGPNWTDHNSQKKYRQEHVDKNRSLISRDSQRNRSERERWKSDWRDRRVTYNESQFAKCSMQENKPKEYKEVKGRTVPEQTELKAPKEQRVELKFTSNQNSSRSSKDDQNSSKISKDYIPQFSLSNRGSIKNEFVCTTGKTCTDPRFNTEIPSVSIKQAEMSGTDDEKSIEEECGVDRHSDLSHVNMTSHMEYTQVNYTKESNSVTTQNNNITDETQNANHNLSSNGHAKRACNGRSGNSLTNVGGTDSQIDLTERDVSWNNDNNCTEHIPENFRDSQNTSNQISQHKNTQEQFLNRRLLQNSENITDNPDKNSAQVTHSSPTLSSSLDQQKKDEELQKKEGVTIAPTPAEKHYSETKPSEQESCVDEFFRQYAQHNNTGGQPVRLPDGSLPLNVFKVSCNTPGLGIQPACTPTQVIPGSSGVAPMHPSQYRICTVPPLYQPCGMMPDMNTLQYGACAYYDGSIQRQMVENSQLMQGNTDCCSGPVAHPGNRFMPGGSQRPGVMPVTLSSQTPDAAFSNYGPGPCSFESSQQTFGANQVSNIVKNGPVPVYGGITGAVPVPPIDIMIQGMGTSHPNGVAPPPGVYGFTTVPPLTGISRTRGQMEPGLVITQIPQENIVDRPGITQPDSGSQTCVSQEAQTCQSHTNAGQVTPQVSKTPHNTFVGSVNRPIPISQESSNSAGNRILKSHLPPGSATNPNLSTVLPYPPGQTNDITPYLSLQQNGIGESVNGTTFAFSQWPLCCYSPTDISQLQGVHHLAAPDGSVIRFQDMTPLQTSPFKHPGPTNVDHVWYPGVSGVMSVPENVDSRRISAVKQFVPESDVHADLQGTIMPQMHGIGGHAVSQVSTDSQPTNDHSQIYLPGVSHIPTHSQLGMAGVGVMGHPSMHTGMSAQLPLHGDMQQQVSHTQNIAGTAHSMMSQGSSASGNGHRTAISNQSGATLPNGQIYSDLKANESVSSDKIQKFPGLQNSSDMFHSFQGESTQDVAQMTEKLRQVSMAQHNTMQSSHSINPIPGSFQSSTPKAHLYYEKIQSLLCQPPEVVCRILQQMQLAGNVPPVSGAGAQGFTMPPAGETWSVVHNPQAVPGRPFNSQSHSAFSMSSRGRTKGRGRLRDSDI